MERDEIFSDKIIYSDFEGGSPSELIINGDTNSKRLALTFDAGYEDRQTSEILGILKRHNIKSTFFLTGVWVELFPEMAARIAAEGHEIGNHSYNHPDFTKTPRDKIIDNILRGEAAIIKATGINPRPLFREPYGHWNGKVFKAVGAAGYKYSIYWSLDPVDWKMPPSRVIANRILRKVRGGDIILMHLSTNTTAAALEIVIRNLEAFGYEFTKVSEFLKIKIK